MRHLAVIIAVLAVNMTAGHASQPMPRFVPAQASSSKPVPKPAGAVARRVRGPNAVQRTLTAVDQTLRTQIQAFSVPVTFQLTPTSLTLSITPTILYRKPEAKSVTIPVQKITLKNNSGGK